MGEGKVRPFTGVDLRAARLLIERTDDSPLKKRREIERLEKAFRQGRLGFKPNEPEQHRWWRCEARFMLGEYGDWSGWEYRDPWAARIWFENPFPVPVWNLKPCKRVYVIGEQGIGDEVLFAQCLHDVKKVVEEVIVETQPRLIPLFQGMGVKVVPAKLVPHESGEGERRMVQPFDADGWVSLGDLPRVFRKRKEDFPRIAYLAAPETHPSRKWSGRTGISWRGAQGVEKRILEAFPDGVSLQYDQAWDEDAEHPSIDLKNDLEGVLSLIQSLERVVTVSTSVAHLSAALGKETHVVMAPKNSGRRGGLLPFKWLNEKCPNGTWWYSPNVRTYKSWEEFASLNKNMFRLPGRQAD